MVRYQAVEEGFLHSHRRKRWAWLMLSIPTWLWIGVISISSVFLFYVHLSRRQSFNLVKGSSLGRVEYLGTQLDPIDPDDLFVSYLPHSGFHNQRIALENALTLSKILNRTLLLPKCLLGPPIPFIEFDTLKNKLSSVDLLKSSHCTSEENSSDQRIISKQCEEAKNQVWFNWSELIDVASISKLVRLIDRPSFDDEDTYRALKIYRPEVEVYQFKDQGKYEFRFLVHHPEENMQWPELEKFEKWINVEETLKRKLKHVKLIEFGSMFGSSRLKIVEGASYRGEFQSIRTAFRKLMVFNSAPLINLSQSIAHQIVSSASDYHDGFYGVHVRIGDSFFKAEAKQRVHQLIQSLVQDQLKLPAHTLSLAVREAEKIESSSPLPRPKLSSILPCRASLHTHPDLRAYNRPLYIATDARAPTQHPRLRKLIKAFPCSFLLENFDVHPLKHPNLIPLLDALILSRAVGVVGTDGSTFSRFVTDILFEKFRNQTNPPIVTT